MRREPEYEWQRASAETEDALERLRRRRPERDVLEELRQCARRRHREILERLWPMTPEQRHLVAAIRRELRRPRSR